VPCFLVGAVFGGAAVGSKEEFELSVGGVDGNDEPDGDSNNVGRDEVKLVGAVGDAVRVNVTFVAFVVPALRGLDLNAQEAGALAGLVGRDDGNVVGGGIAPWTGDGESLLGGAGHEEEFGPFPLLLVVGEADAGLVWHGVAPGFGG